MTPPYPRLPRLPLLAGAFIVGIALASLFETPWWTTAVAALALLAAAATLHLAPLRGPRPAVPVALIAALAALLILGHLRFEAAGAPTSSPLATARGDHTVVGIVRDDPRVRGLYARVDIQVERLDGRPVDGGARITMFAPLDPLETGDRLELRVELEAPPELEDFDYPGYLASRGIYAVGGFPDSWRTVGKHEDWRTALRAARRWMNANIERTLPAPESALAAGVLVGERGTMPPDLTEALRQTGTTHLVVVSGQNVALLLGIAISVLTLAVPRRRAALALLFALPAYVALVGADPPVVRAAIMAVGIVIASALGRRTPRWIYLTYAVAVMLAHDPGLARDVAFQLSATATAGVMVVAPALSSFTLSRLGWPEVGGRATVVELAATATGATLAVLPVQVAAFERVSIVAIPANVIVAPLYEATVFVAALAALAGTNEVAAPAARPLITFVPAAFIWIVERLAALPGGEFTVRAPLFAGALWYAGLAAATWWLDRRGERQNALEPTAGTSFGWAAGLAVVAIGLWLAVLQPPSNDARVTFLDVGHGLAVLIEDGGQRVLFDTGPPDGAVALALPPEVGRLDAVLLSHTDLDHVGGLATVIDRFPPATLLAATDTLEEIARRLPAAQSVQTQPFDIGDRIHLTDRTTMEALSPPVAAGTHTLDSDNDGSMVILITVGNRRILVTADIEEPAEQWLVDSGHNLAADVLLIPHQGSKTSSTPAFLEAVSPAAAILSASATNPYGHPAEEVMARYEGIPIFRTDHHGNVTVSSDGDRLWISAGH